MDKRWKKICEDVVKNEFPKFIQMLERNLDFDRWGFTRVFSGVGQFSPIVIYESEACRVMFTWQPPQHLHDETPTMDVRYGRLHAPNDEEIITWKGQKCYCWHDVRKVLFFLDGLSPSQAASDPFFWPIVMDKFQMSSGGKGWTQQEYMAKMHATIWEHYDSSIFDLFDLRRSDLWQQYTAFLKEYYRIEEEEARVVYRQRGIGWEPNYDPPLYQIC